MQKKRDCNGPYHCPCLGGSVFCLLRLSNIFPTLGSMCTSYSSLKRGGEMHKRGGGGDDFGVGLHSPV